MASDAYMEVETRSLIGETFDERFGMDAADDPDDNVTPRRQGAFEISSYSMAATSNREDPDDPKPAATPATPAGGKSAPGAAAATSTQTTLKQFTIKKAIDRASPDLFQICCQQSKIQWAVISLREAGDPSRKPWLILEFSDLYVDSFTWDVELGSSGEEVKGQETVAFSFTTILFKYTSQEQSGEHKSMSIKGWNRHEHKTDPVPDLGSENW